MKMNERVITPEYSEMVQKLLKPGADILATMTPEKMNLIHCILGTSGEFGELVAADANMFLCDIDHKHEAIKNMVEELGDFSFYFQGLCIHFGWGSSYDDLQSFALQVPKEKLIKPFRTGMEMPDLAISSSEVLDLIKKYCVYNKQFGKGEKEISLHQIAYVMSFVFEDLIRVHAQHSDLPSWAEILTYNEIKLLKGTNARYSSGSYSDAAAIERADKQD